jgi:hypothetical protein
VSATIVGGSNAIEAWRNAAQVLRSSGGQLSNVITTIDEPCAFDLDWITRFSPRSVQRKSDALSDVVNTIFPYKLWQRSQTRDELYANYLTRHDRAHKWSTGRHAWGTYFERLIRFPPEGLNQLERAIEKLNKWPRNTTGLVFHLSSPTVDAPRTRGGPCWHFGELLWNPDGTLDLVAVYRNHDFFNKVAGNFIGLGQLLQFICDQSSKKPGRLICHSVHAYFDASKASVQTLIQA